MPEALLKLILERDAEGRLDVSSTPATKVTIIRPSMLQIREEKTDGAKYIPQLNKLRETFAVLSAEDHSAGPLFLRFSLAALPDLEEFEVEDQALIAYLLLTEYAEFSGNIPAMDVVVLKLHELVSTVITNCQAVEKERGHRKTTTEGGGTEWVWSPPDETSWTEADRNAALFFLLRELNRFDRLDEVSELSAKTVERILLLPLALSEQPEGLPEIDLEVLLTEYLHAFLAFGECLAQWRGRIQKTDGKKADRVYEYLEFFEDLHDEFEKALKKLEVDYREIEASLRERALELNFGDDPDWVWTARMLHLCLGETYREKPEGFPNCRTKESDEDSPRVLVLEEEDRRLRIFPSVGSVLCLIDLETASLRVETSGPHHAVPGYFALRHVLFQFSARLSHGGMSSISLRFLADALPSFEVMSAPDIDLVAYLTIMDQISALRTDGGYSVEEVTVLTGFVFAAFGRLNEPVRALGPIDEKTALAFYENQEEIGDELFRKISLDLLFNFLSDLYHVQGRSPKGVEMEFFLPLLDLPRQISNYLESDDPAILSRDLAFMSEELESFHAVLELWRTLISKHPKRLELLKLFGVFQDFIDIIEAKTPGDEEDVDFPVEEALAELIERYERDPVEDHPLWFEFAIGLHLFFTGVLEKWGWEAVAERR